MSGTVPLLRHTTSWRAQAQLYLYITFTHIVQKQGCDEVRRTLEANLWSCTFTNMRSLLPEFSVYEVITDEAMLWIMWPFRRISRFAIKHNFEDFLFMGHGVISQRNGALNDTAVKISQGSENANFSTTLRFLREIFFACFAVQNDVCVKCCCYFW